MYIPIANWMCKNRCKFTKCYLGLEMQRSLLAMALLSSWRL